LHNDLSHIDHVSAAIARLSNRALTPESRQRNALAGAGAMRNHDDVTSLCT
jgi:hypothetical protein